MNQVGVYDWLMVVELCDSLARVEIPLRLSEDVCAGV